MLRGSLILAMLLHAVTCSSIAAKDISEKALQEIAVMEYRGIGFSSSPKDLLKAIPGARLNNSHVGSQKGILTYEIRGGDTDNDCVLLRFFENELVEIDFIYFPKRLASQGGKDALATQAVKNYGSPTIKNGETLFWDFPSMDRIVVVSYEDKKWSKHIYHRSRRLGIPDYKDTSVDIDKSWMRVEVGPQVPYQQQRATNAVPSSVMKIILRDARQDHPVSQSTQNYVVGKQARAYLKWKNFGCPRRMPAHIFKYLRAKIARDHLENYSVRNFVLKKQLAAFEVMKDMKAPEGMAGSHFFTLRKSSIRRHPYNYSTQLFVLNRYIDKYLLYREAGNGGDSILRYLLRFE